MQSLLRSALLLFAALTVITGLAYPVVVTGLGRLLFPTQVDGNLIFDKDGRLIGSELIGQHFTAPKYFWGRLSATAGQPYNGAASGGSNYGPLNPALQEAVKARIAALQATDPAAKPPFPVDLVTASASGLDPHISPAAALYQVARVARVRGLDAVKVRQLVEKHIETPLLGFLGEAQVNVLELNRALDE